LPLGGFSQADDFVGAIAKTNMRTQLGWTIDDIAGGVTVSAQLDTATEDGILRMLAGSTSGDGGTCNLPAGRLVAGCPAYMEFGAKVRVQATNTNITAWSGFADTAAGDWDTASATNAVGIRVIAAGAAANWYGVVKDGAGAGNESTVDLGYAADNTWRFLGFRVTATGIQFCEWDAADIYRRGLIREDIGSEVTTNIPTGSLYKVALGVLTTTAATRYAEVDWWGIGGPVAR
jgi:hypothetical protein